MPYAGRVVESAMRKGGDEESNQEAVSPDWNLLINAIYTYIYVCACALVYSYVYLYCMVCVVLDGVWIFTSLSISIDVSMCNVCIYVWSCAWERRNDDVLNKNLHGQLFLRILQMIKSGFCNSDDCLDEVYCSAGWKKKKDVWSALSAYWNGLQESLYSKILI